MVSEDMWVGKTKKQGELKSSRTFQRLDRTDAHMSSQRMWQYAQDMHRFKSYAVQETGGNAHADSCF